MLFTITGKHIDITEATKAHAQNKTSKLPRYYNSINQIEVMIDGNEGGKISVEIIARADSYDPLTHQSEVLEYRYDINQSVWQQASELRRSGKLLRFGKKIKCPVVAIHGDYDPHPAEGVREPLSRLLKDFRFILLEKCGHEPWIEKFAKERFYEVLKGEI